MTRELSKAGCVFASLSGDFSLSFIDPRKEGVADRQSLAVILINSGLLYELKYLEKGTRAKTLPISKREGWGQGGEEERLQSPSR